MDMFEGRNIATDARRILDTVAAGGVAIFPLTVGYGMVGHTKAAVARIYEAKARSFGKPCGMFANWELFMEISDVDDQRRNIVRTIIDMHNLPFSIVAPFRQNHPLIQSLDAYALANASKSGTMDLLMNAGALHDAVAQGARGRGMAVVGSSANRSLTGSKFRLEDVEDQVRAAADLCIDYGLSRYHNDEGLGSSIIDLISFETIRVGCVYDQICQILLDEHAIDLKAIGMAGRDPQTK